MKKFTYVTVLPQTILMAISAYFMLLFRSANGWPVFQGILIFFGVILAYYLIRIVTGAFVTWYDRVLIWLGYLPALLLVYAVVAMFALAIGFV